MHQRGVTVPPGSRTAAIGTAVGAGTPGNREPQGANDKRGIRA